MTALEHALASGDFLRWCEALAGAVAAGPAGEAELVDVLPLATDFRLTLAVAGLGAATGPLGPPALRALAHDADAPREARAAATLSLARRSGPAAADDLLRVLHERGRGLADAAITGLAVVGDDRGWDAVLQRLGTVLRRPARVPTVPFSELQTSVAYLGQHLGGRGSARAVKLVGLLRRRWGRILDGERAWLAELWPACAPGGPSGAEVEPPESGALQRWVFDAVYLGPAPWNGPSPR
jgi:hypothetical protein